MLDAAVVRLHVLLGLQLQPLELPHALCYTDVHDCQLYFWDPQHAI